jgi:hypothetical protein
MVMTVKIKEIVVRYEDDGAVSPLSATEHHEKYAPLQMVVHHHCSPPPDAAAASGTVHAEGKPKEFKIDLNDIATKESAESDGHES